MKIIKTCIACYQDNIFLLEDVGDMIIIVNEVDCELKCKKELN